MATRSNRHALALLLALAVLAPSSVPAAIGSSARNTISLARGWIHLPLAAAGLPVGPYGTLHGVQLVEGGPGLLLFSPTNPTGNGGGLWTSADGRTWKRVPLAAPAFHPGVMPAHLYAAGKLLVMTGPPPAPGASVQTAPIWVSRDGRSWQRGSEPPTAYLGPFAPGGDGVIAFGGLPLAPSSLVRVWTSVNGLRWRQLTAASQAFAAPFTQVMSVVPGGPGLIAAGMVPKSTGHAALGLAVWTSHDGRQWTRVPNSSSVFGSYGDQLPIEQVQLVAGPHGVLILGDASTRAIFWASPDGVHWRRGTRIPFGSMDLLRGSVAAWQQGFVGLSDLGGDAAVWSSRDGLSWSRVGSDELLGGSVQSAVLTGFGAGVVAAGSFAVHPQPSCISTKPPPDLRVFHPATLLWSPGRSQAAPLPASGVSDPQSFDLLPADLPADLQPVYNEPTFQGSYVDLCREDPALGPHRAYVLSFASGLHGEALSIITQSTAAARAAFRLAGRLTEGCPLLDCAGVYPSISILARQEVAAGLHIGEQTRFFRLQVREAQCDFVRAFAAPRQCSDTTYWAFAVAWRQGRAIGEVVSAPLGPAFRRPCTPPQPAPDLCTAGGGQVLAIRLARRQLAHLKALNPKGT